MKRTIKAAVVGGRSITGKTIAELASNHPKLKIDYIFSADKDIAGTPYVNTFKDLAHIVPADLKFSLEEEKRVISLAKKSDVLFLAGKSEESDMRITKAVGDKCKIITMGGVYRLKDPAVFQAAYKKTHMDPVGLERAVYGLPEIGGRSAIMNADLIANPGCFATAVSLALVPLVFNGYGKSVSKSVIVAESGKSGSGYSLKPEGLFNNANENIRPYGLNGSHQHIPEIHQNLLKADWFIIDKSYQEQRSFGFIPKAGSYERGIMAICTVPVNITMDEVQEMYRVYYEGEAFINILDKGAPEVKWVAGKNRVDIGFGYDKFARQLCIYCSLDNVLKGASGTAIQNMNLMFGLPEIMGLEHLGAKRR